MKISTWALSVAALLAPALGAQQQTPQEILEALEAGNARYAAGESEPRPMGPGVRRSLAERQAPKAVVVTCTDSRVVPEHLFNAGLGDLYVLRVAGPVADPDTVAGLEHATVELGARVIVVLGHENCSTIAAALDPRNASPALARLLERIQPAVQRARALGLERGELARGAEEENVHQAVEDALRQSQVLRSLRDSGRIAVARARYELATGEVQWLEDRPFGDGLHAAPGGETANGLPRLPPHVALRMLQAGHRRYLSAALPTGDLSRSRREELATGQQPLAIVVTDGDSRIPPEHIFDLGLGEIVTIRVAGPVLNDEVLASIDLAAAHTGASLCLVLGNEDNGIIRKALEGQLANRPMTEAMRQLAAKLTPVVERARAAGGSSEQIATRAAAMQLQHFVDGTRKRSETVRRLEERGTFAMLAAIYDLESGDLTWVKTSGPSTSTKASTHGSADGHDAHDSAGHGDAHGRDAHDSAGHGDAHGHDAHGSAGHGDAHGHDAHGSAGHGDAHGHDAHGSAGHGDAHGHDAHDSAGHGDAHGHDAHDSAGHGDAHGHDAHDSAGHGDAHGHDAHGSAGHGDAHGHDAHSSAGHGDAHGHDAHGHGDLGGALDTDEHLLASLADAREHGLGGGDGHGDAHGEAPATAKHDDSLTILLIVITGLLAAGVGVSLLLWMQRQQAQGDAALQAAADAEVDARS